MKKFFSYKQFYFGIKRCKWYYYNLIDAILKEKYITFDCDSPCGLMDKASASSAGDWVFESPQGLSYVFSSIKFSYFSWLPVDPFYNRMMSIEINFYYVGLIIIVSFRELTFHESSIV